MIGKGFFACVSPLALDDFEPGEDRVRFLEVFEPDDGLEVDFEGLAGKATGLGETSLGSNVGIRDVWEAERPPYTI